MKPNDLSYLYLMKKQNGVHKDALQNDTGRVFCFKVMDVSLSDSTTAVLYARKPSGLENYNPWTVDPENNMILYSLTSQTIAEEGITQGQIRVMDQDRVISSFLFCIRVEKSLVSSGAIESKDEFLLLDAALKESRETLKIVKELRQELDERIQELEELIASLVPISDSELEALLKD